MTLNVKTFGPDVNLFVDHSQILQIERLRAGAVGHAQHVGPCCRLRGG
jgi:phosphosulfolactate synthase (CoM biosynthesis protein A)